MVRPLPLALMLAAVGCARGDPTADFPPDQSRAIAAVVRPCWAADEAAGSQVLSVHLTITTDETGTVRAADVAAEDAGRLTDPAYRAFTVRAQRAVLNPACARLPLPAAMLGARHTFNLLLRYDA